MKKKKACKIKHYKADPESKKDSMKAYYDQNRELILASKQEANQKAKRDKQTQEKKSYAVGVFAMYKPTVWVQ